MFHRCKDSLRQKLGIRNSKYHVESSSKRRDDNSKWHRRNNIYADGTLRKPLSAIPGSPGFEE